MVNQKLGERIYDPFCGTGGFLTESFRHVMRTNGTDMSFDLKSFKQECISGTEVTETARIAKMNMVLYGDGHSGIKRANSLENPVENKYDIALTNIPFSQDLSRNIGNLYYDGLAKQSSDATCLLHCFKSLRPGGRMAAVVPEGFLSNRDVKETRKFLLDSTDLHSVVSLPGGCFAPYTMAKTCILYLKGKEKYTTCKFWFFSVTIEDESYLDKIFASSFGHNDEIENEIMLLKAMSCKIENIKKPYYSLLQNRSQLKVDEKAKQLKEVTYLKKGKSITEKKQHLE